MKLEPGDITAQLHAHNAGDPLSLNSLFTLVQPELRRLARSAMRDESPHHTLQPTALINEAFIRLFGGQPIPWANRQHFFARAALAMRSTLCDHARRASAAKRLPASAPFASTPLSIEQIVQLDIALDKLTQINPQAATVVELHFFGGFSFDDIAAALEITPRTVYRRWQWARSALLLHLAGPLPAGSHSSPNPLNPSDHELGTAGEDPTHL